ncbi:MAG TPA: hypothetical protein VM658_02320 [bacterium]|nr:hypothetical protein [bacterium]
MKKAGISAGALFITLAILYFFIPGCEGGGGSNGGGREAPIPDKMADNVILIDEITSVLLSDTTDGTYTYDYTGAAPDINPDDILLSSEGYGYLRKVISVNDTGTSLLVGTTQATLEEAFENLTIGLTQALTPAGVQSQQPLQEGIYFSRPAEMQPLLADQFYINFDGVVLYEEGGNQVVLSGDITFKPDLNFQAQIRWFSLKYLVSTITLNETANINITSTIEILSLQKEVEIARYYFAPIPAGPVEIAPILTVMVGINGELSVDITTGITQQATLTAGLKYENRAWSPISEFSNQFSYQPPVLSTNCSFKGYAGPQLNLMIYGVTGPYINTSGYLLLEADPCDDPWWKLYAGLFVKAGVKIEVLSHVIAGYEVNIINHQRLLASGPAGECETWNMEITVTYSLGPPECICGPACNNSFLGVSGSYPPFEVQHQGSSFSSDSWLPNTINGTMDAATIEMSIILPPELDNGCGDFNNFSGEINGNTISGTYSGNDCGGGDICSWGGNFIIGVIKPKP